MNPDFSISILFFLLVSTGFAGCLTSEPPSRDGAPQLQPLASLHGTANGTDWMAMRGEMVLEWLGDVQDQQHPDGRKAAARAFAVNDSQAWIVLGADSMEPWGEYPSDGSGRAVSHFLPSTASLRSTGMLIGLAMVGETESEGELIWLGVPLRFSWSGRTLHLAADVTIVSGNESLDVPLNMVLEFDDACPVPTRYWSGFAGPEALAEQQPFWVFDGECVTMDGPSVARSPMDVPFPRTTWDRHPQSGDSRLPPLEAAIMAGRSDPRTQEVFEGDSWYVQLAEGTPMAGGAAQWDVTVSNVDRTIAFQASIAQGIGIVTDVVSDAARGDARHPIALRYPLLSIATMEDVCDDRFGDAWDGRLSYTDLNGETLVFVGDRLSAGLVTFQCAPSSLLRFDATTGWPLNDIGALV